MRMLFGIGLIQALAVGTPTPPPALQPGDTYLVTKTVDSSSHGNDSSSSTTHDVDQLVERVLTVGDAGSEIEWDLPASVTEDDRARSWQFPARVFKPISKPMELRNAGDLEKRLGDWLKAGKIPRTACGHWIFTWNAFKIECDPQSVLRTIATFDVISGDLREGEGYPHGEAGQSAPLTRKPGSTGLVAEWQVNPADVRREQAEADVVIAEIMHKPSPTMDAALKARASEAVSGTVKVTFDGMGSAVQRRTRITALVITQPDGKTEHRTETEVVERKRSPSRGG